MRLRTIAAGTALAVATTVGGGTFAAFAEPGVASAQVRPSAALTTTVPCTAGGVASTCTVKVTSLHAVNRTIEASGTVTHGSTTVPFSGVPVTTPGTTNAANAPSAAAAACPVLALTLGPLHLDLLGLVVDLNQVVLNITAQPGSGQLLGNLLCAVTHLLDSNGSTSALNSLLNQITTLLSGL